MNSSEGLGFIPAIRPPPPIPGGFFVYLLLCANGTFYVGSTNDVPRRLQQHQSGTGARHTRDNLIMRLVHTEGPFSQMMAVRRERQIKKWTRAKNEALIQGDRWRLQHLSQSHD